MSSKNVPNMSFWEEATSDYCSRMVEPIYRDIFEADDSYEWVEHTGTPHDGSIPHSGRFLYGSGENPYQRDHSFANQVRKMRQEGCSEEEIMKSFNMNSSEYRSKLGVEKSLERDYYVSESLRLQAEGKSSIETGQILGKSPSTIRSYLTPASIRNAEVFASATKVLTDAVGDSNIVDIGAYSETRLGIGRKRFENAVDYMKENGYQEYVIKVRQQATGNFTNTKVLAPPGMTKEEVIAKRGDIKVLNATIDDETASIVTPKPYVPISSDRVYVRYAEEGGRNKDGVIELRRDVPDLDLGNAHYAQVRIGVDGTHYLKGMAMYGDDIPDGYDVVFNTNKSKNVPKLDVFKPVKDDPEFPFGSLTKSPDELTLVNAYYTDKDGKKKQSAINVVREEGEWDTWTPSLAAQFLSKQYPSTAKKQLDKTIKQKQEQYDDIMSIDNPVLRKKLLTDFADECDSAAVHLKAAALPRQATKVLLPVPSLKDNEVYAPTFEDGEEVILVRYPHGGVFEIPRLRVNNQHKAAVKSIGQTVDAIGINPKTAEQLSGADFDGDTALVIPTKTFRARTSNPYKELIDFDGKTEYAYQPGMKVLSKKSTGREMGIITNLITDMTVKNAPPEHIIRAVKHSMVIIDAAKHKLDYTRSYKDNDIAELKRLYQTDPETGKVGGVSTLFSKAKNPVRVTRTKDIRKIDPKTGEKILMPDPDYYYKPVLDKDGKVTSWQKKEKLVEVPRMSITKDARTLSSGTVIENIYADYANSCKNLANEARKSTLSVGSFERSPQSAKLYSKQVESLNKKLEQSRANAPLERKANALCGKLLAIRLDENPELNYDKDAKKKERSKLLKLARDRVGAHRYEIDVTEDEWEAIQNRAVSKTVLEEIIRRSDIDKLKTYAMPKQTTKISAADEAKIKRLLANGNTIAEVAEAVGVSTSTVTAVEVANR